MSVDDTHLLKFIDLMKGRRETYIQLTLTSAAIPDDDLVSAFIVLVKGCDVVIAMCEARLTQETSKAN